MSNYMWFILPWELLLLCCHVYPKTVPLTHWSTDRPKVRQLSTRPTQVNPSPTSRGAGGSALDDHLVLIWKLTIPCPGGFPILGKWGQ